MFSIKDNYLLSSIIILSLFLRFYKLDYQSLWIDEIYTLNFANPDNTLSELFGFLKNDGAHPPLYYLLVHLLFKIFGYHHLVMKVLSALFGVFATVIAYFIGRNLKGKSLGLLFSLFVAVNPFFIEYSQEGRMYSMLAAFSLLTILTFLNYIKNNSTKNIIYFFLSSILLFNTHLYGIFFGTALIFCFLVYEYVNHLFTINLKVYAFIFIVFLIPLLPTFWIFSGNIERSSFWIDKPTPFFFVEMGFVFFGKNYFLVLMSILLIFWGVYKSTSENDNKFFFVSLYASAFFVIAFAFIFSLVKFPILFHRYLIVILPIILLSIAYAVCSIKNKNYILIFAIFYGGLNLYSLFYTSKYYDSVRKQQLKEAITKLSLLSKKEKIYIKRLDFYQYFVHQTNNINELSVPNISKSNDEQFWILDEKYTHLSKSESLFLSKNYKKTDSLKLNEVNLYKYNRR